MLDEKSINYQVMDGPSARDCAWKLTYLGKWSWDLAIYLSYAEIKVYHNGVLDGEAVYDSTRGGGRVFEKFVDGETKVQELVEELIQQRQSTSDQSS